MEVVTGATGIVLTKVGALLQEEYVRQTGVQKDVESLQTELLFMRAALCKVAEVPAEQLDEQVRAWASNVKELSCDMEDAVDTFNVQVTATKVQVRAWSLDFNKLGRLKARHDLADVIAEMKDLTMQVAELRDRYKLDGIDVTNTVLLPDVKQVQDDVKDVVVSRTNLFLQLWTWWRDGICYQIQEVVRGRRWRSGGAANRTPLEIPIPIPVPRLIGMKDLSARTQVMEDLGKWVGNGIGPGVLYIVGDRGAGKTTIATALYRKFGHLFHRRAMVTATAMVLDDITILIKKLNQQLGTSIIRPLRDEPAVTTPSIPADLETKIDDAAICRYLVLIDRVESDKLLEELWKSTKPVLLGGSKIIVTTRLSAVASLWKDDKVDKRHDMVAGGEKEAKMIFDEALAEKIGWPEDGDEQKEDMTSKNKIPSRVWEMCKEQPVAIVAMAGYAACNPDKSVDEWKQVCNKLLPDSVKSLTRNDVPRVLSHCYHDMYMSAEIKTCTLYLSMYPKGQKMSRKNLTRRWIAEGFVAENPGQSVEEVADGYLAQLVMRKFIQPVDQSMNGRVRNLRVHDMVHDFIVSKASEENLVTVVGGNYSPPPQSGKVRRLSHSVMPLDDGAGGRQENASSSVGVNMYHVRSLSVYWAFNSSSKQLPPRSLHSPIVQVLDLQGCQDEDLTTKYKEYICKMFLLKYLGLRGSCISDLGSGIGRLQNLETLDVRETAVKELPDTVWKLQQLVNILGGKKKTREALKLRLPSSAKRTSKDGSKITMKALRVLSGIEINHDLALHLEHLPNLRKLAIYKVNNDTKDQKSMLQFLSRARLQNLVIIGEDNLSDFFSDVLVSTTLPTSLRLLTALELSGKLDQFPTWIQQLVELEKLTLPIAVLRSDPQLLTKLSVLKKLFSITFSHAQTLGSDDELGPPYGQEIIVPKGGYKNLRLLRFFAPLMPLLSFLDDAMPSLEMIHLRFRKFDGLHGLHNLKTIQEVHLEVHVEADDFTKAMVDNLANATRQAGPRIIRDKYINTDKTTPPTSVKRSMFSF